MTALERAARALCTAEGRDPDEMFGAPGNEYPFWHLRRADARAVLTAYFEDSDALVDSAFLAVMNAKDRELSLPISAWAERNLLKRRISVAIADVTNGMHATAEPEKLTQKLAQKAI